MKKLYINIDNTVTRLIEYYLETYNKRFKDNLDTDVLKTYNELKFVSYILKKRKNSYFEEEDLRERSIVYNEQFWLTLPIFQDAKDIIEKLYQEYDCYFIISYPWMHSNKMFMVERILWLKRNMSFFNHNKILFEDNNIDKNAILIGDCNYGEKFETWIGPKIKVNYLYNKDIQADASFDPLEWEKVPEILKNLEEKNVSTEKSK
jgi:5'(3')-deoxyribonucleotidase